MSDIRRIRSRREWEEATAHARRPGPLKRLLYAIGDWLARHGLKGRQPAVSFICPIHGEFFPINTGTSLALCPACAQTHAPVPVRLWQTCPVCGGCCTVPADFYQRLGIATNTSREPCRRCGASGTIERPPVPS